MGIFKILKADKYKGEQLKISHYSVFNKHNKKDFLKEGSL